MFANSETNNYYDKQNKEIQSIVMTVICYKIFPKKK